MITLICAVVTRTSEICSAWTKSDQNGKECIGRTKMWFGRSGWDGNVVWEEMVFGRRGWDEDVVWWDGDVVWEERVGRRCGLVGRRCGLGGEGGTKMWFGGTEM